MGNVNNVVCLQIVPGLIGVRRGFPVPHAKPTPSLSSATTGARIFKKYSRRSLSSALHLRSATFSVCGSPDGAWIIYDGLPLIERQDDRLQRNCRPSSRWPTTSSGAQPQPSMQRGGRVPAYCTHCGSGRVKRSPAGLRQSDAAMIPAWENAESPGFAALKLDPWRLRVMPGSVMIEGKADLRLTWQES